MTDIDERAEPSPGTAEEPAIAQLETVWSSLGDASAGLATSRWDQPTACPGWSVRDHLSHLIGIERSLMGESAPPAPAVLADHVKNAVGQMNEAWVAQRRARPGPVVLDEFTEVTAHRLSDLRRLDDKDFDRVGWSPIGQVPYRDFMTVRVFDSWVHEQDVRQAVGRPGGRHGPGEAITLDRITGALPYVVGKKVAPPDGTVVRWDVKSDDGTTRSLSARVDAGRAQMAEPAPFDPAVTVGLDTSTYWRLGCGRLGPDEALASGSLRLKGDEGLGRRVVGAMNIMI